MNLKQLEAFVRVAEEKSFSAAARRLYLTQPTVSAHVASLEKELDACLLIRGSRGVEMTNEGRELYQRAKQMLALEQQILEHFHSPDRRGGILRIAASTIPSQYLLPEMMARYREAYPLNQLQVSETDSAGVVRELLSCRADIGFTGTVLEEQHCQYYPFCQDELIVITPVAERFLQRQGTAVETWLREEPVILREEGSGTRREAVRMLEEAGIHLGELKVAASIQNQETIKRSVENGMGVSILSALAAEEEIRRGRLLGFPLSGSGGKRNMNLVMAKGISRIPAANRFIEIMRQIWPELEI